MDKLTRAEVEHIIRQLDDERSNNPLVEQCIQVAKALLDMDDALEDAQTIITWYEVGGFLGGRGVEAMTRRLARVEAAQLVRATL